MKVKNQLKGCDGMTPLQLQQENSLNVIEKALNGVNNFKDGMANSWNNVIELRDGVSESLDTIAELSKMIMKTVDWFATIMTHPIIIATAVDKLSIVVIMTLIILKILGFDNLDKWIWLTVLIKVVTMALM